MDKLNADTGIQRIAVTATAFLFLLSLALGNLALAQTTKSSALEPADTSSPRATLTTLRENFERAFRDFYLLNELDRVDYTSMERALRTLDTSKLAPAQRRRMSIEALVQLHDVLSKVELPTPEEVPDRASMHELPADEPRRWQIPGTSMIIERVDDGAREGEYLFSPETVARAREFYDQSRELPYRFGAIEDLYERMVVMGGVWIPEKLIAALPAVAKYPLLGQALWKWIGMFLTVCLWVGVVYVLSRLATPRDGKPHYWLRFVFTLAVLQLTVFMRDFITLELLITGSVYSVVDTSIFVLFYIIGAVAILNLGRAIAVSVIALPRVDKNSIDANLISVGFAALAWVSAIALLAKGASDLGVPLAAVVTSLGVGGLAFAMAARPTLENLIAGVTLYLDKPVRLGEFCQFGEVMGTVERIGLRSTRIRRWGGNILSIPNSQFAEYQLDNYNDNRDTWIRQRLRLRYETSADQLKFILVKLREMLFAHPRIDSPRVRLIGFGEDALTVEILAYSDTGVWSEWHAIREDVFLRIMEIVESAGTRLALPSQTTYFARDSGVDEDLKTAAENQVQAWTEAGQLPFPNMTEQQREALAGTLDFPPTGSIEHSDSPSSYAGPEKV